MQSIAAERAARGSRGRAGRGPPLARKEIKKGAHMPKWLTRPGETSNRGQQVWRHWDFATEEEKRVTLEENEREIHTGTVLARDDDHVTAKTALRRAEATRLENEVAEALHRSRRHGGTWDEVTRALGIRPGSVSPRWKPLRHRHLIVFALDEAEVEPVDLISDEQTEKARTLFAKFQQLQFWAPLGLHVRFQRRDDMLVLVECGPGGQAEFERIKRVFEAAGIEVLDERKDKPAGYSQPEAPL